MSDKDGSTDPHAESQAQRTVDYDEAIAAALEHRKIARHLIRLIDQQPNLPKLHELWFVDTKVPTGARALLPFEVDQLTEIARVYAANAESYEAYAAELLALMIASSMDSTS